MDWKQKIVITFTNLKGRKNLCIWIAGSVLLCMVLPYALLVNHDNSRKLNTMLEELETLKSFMSAQNIDLALMRHLKYSDNEGADIGRRDMLVNSRTQKTILTLNYKAQAVIFPYQPMVMTTDLPSPSAPESIAGGSWYDNTGAATNHQCLPNETDWGRFTENGENAFMYGVEYEDSMSGIMDMSNVQKGLNEHTVPCTVCRSNIRTSSLMIPAKNVCYEGWYLEYDGYLMAGAAGHKASTQYICVDGAPEADPAGYRDEDGAFLYRVTAHC